MGERIKERKKAEKAAAQKAEAQPTEEKQERKLTGTKKGNAGSDKAA